jgi:hypothetical protein
MPDRFHFHKRFDFPGGLALTCIEPLIEATFDNANALQILNNALLQHD